MLHDQIARLQTIRQICVLALGIGLLIAGMETAATQSTNTAATNAPATNAPATNAPATNARATISGDEMFLDALQGTWSMTGTLLGKPVRYRAEGQRVLQGGFLMLHMIDLGSPPGYEADVFIGYDPNAHDYIAHWLDRFGAAGARVVGRGERKGDELVVTFPYAEGAFRDTFTWQATSESWTLLLESRASDGSWSTFARYTLTRVPD